MQVKRLTFVFVIVFVLFLSLTTAKAQTAVNYRFLEVLDTAEKPVVDAKVETFGTGGSPLSIQQTDEDGTIKKLPVYYGDYNTSSLKVSKPGYLTYEDKGLFDRYSILLKGENPQYDPDAPIKIELLEMPATSAEREAVEVEQQKRELLLATKQGDAATVRRLLQTGVDANTTDVNGIPAILWAVTKGDVETIKALLAEGADVRSQYKPGRKALLYYLHYTYKGAINDELVRALLEAGADVNAADKNGTTALMLAKQIGDTKIIELLESAGAQHK